MQLSKNFTLADLTVTGARDKETGLPLDNTPDDAQIENLRRLAETVLEPLLAEYPHAHVNSAFRSPEVNTAIGGSKTSEHMNGNAADITVRGVSPIDVAKWAVEAIPDYDQVICEWGWTHIGLRDTPRHQQMTAKKGPDGKAQYSPGFHA